MDKLVQKAALKFLRENGPLYASSMDRLNQAFAANKLNLKGGMTKDQGIAAIKLAQAWSYQYLGADQYMKGQDTVDPEAGKAMLEHPGMRSPENIRKVAEIAGVEEYTQAAQAAGIVPTQPDAPDTDQRFVEQAGAGNQHFDERNGYPSMITNNGQHETNNEHGLPGQVIPSSSGKTYQRVSENLFRAERKARPTSQVQMRPDGRSGVYVGSSMGTGDSRQEAAIRKQMFSDANGKPVNTSASNG